MRNNDIYLDSNDFKSYFTDMKEESRRDHKWLALAAFILGYRFVLDSLKPHGPRERPFLSKPRKVKDIPKSVFRDILKMDIKMEEYLLFVFQERIG